MGLPAEGGYGWGVPPHKPLLVHKTLYWHCHQRRLSRFFMPTKVIKVDYSHYTLVQNTWLGSNMLVGGCYIGPKMAVRALWLCVLKQHTNLQQKHAKLHAQMLPPPSHMEASLTQAFNYIKFRCCVRWMNHRLAHIAPKRRRWRRIYLCPSFRTLNRLCRSTTTQFAIDRNPINEREDVTNIADMFNQHRIE